MLELVGVCSPGFEIDLLKTTIWLHPKGLSNKARLMLKIVLRYNEKEKKDSESRKSKEIRIYFRGKPDPKIEKLYDEKDKIDEKYLENIGSEYTIDEKEVKMGKKLSGKIAIENIPPDSKEKQIYEVIGEGNVEIKLKIKPFSEESFSKANYWILMLSMIVNGGIIEKEPILKRLIGVSRFAWRFQYKMWSHKEYKFSFSKSTINQCKEGQAYVVIPRKLFTSKGHLTLISGGDLTHTISDSDIYILTESLKGDKRKKDSEWMEEGSCGVSWGFAKNIMSLSRDICIEHHEAFPRALTVLFLVQFWAMLILGMAIIWRRGISLSPENLIIPGLVLLILSVLAYFLVNLRNYSFYELNLPGFAGFFDRTLSIVAVCVLFSAPFLSNSANELVRSFNSETFYVFFLISLVAFFAIYLRSERLIESRGTEKLKRIGGPEGRTLFFFAIVLGISIVFSNLPLEENMLFEKLVAFWMINNFASVSPLASWSRDRTLSE